MSCMHCQPLVAAAACKYELDQSVCVCDQMETRLGGTPLDPVAAAALKQHVREEDDWKTSMDEEKALGGLSWETLVFHLHKIASSLTLTENFALSQLQVTSEQVVDLEKEHEVIKPSFVASRRRRYICLHISNSESFFVYVGCDITFIQVNKKMKPCFRDIASWKGHFLTLEFHVYG